MEHKKEQRISVLFMFYSILFCVCLITANVLETKQISLGPANMTAGLIVFPVSYIINDVVCEVWGYGRTRLLIWLGFAMNFFFVGMGAIADWIPGASYWDGEEGFHQIFGLAPRILLPSGPGRCDPLGRDALARDHSGHVENPLRDTRAACHHPSGEVYQGA